jgi:hypothetical protein
MDSTLDFADMTKSVFPILIILILTIIYNFLSKNIPVSYYDEELKVGESYLTQYYISRNLDPVDWVKVSAKDQVLPKLIFGLWLYPKYLNERVLDPELDYSKFLIKRGYDIVDALPNYKYYKYALSENFVTLPRGETGFPDKLVERYGKNILDNLELIKLIRGLNSILLASSVVVIFYFFKRQSGFVFASLFTLLYGFNSLILVSSLKAEAEALFVLFFNSSIVVLYTHLFLKRNLRYLLIFSILTGVCFAIKINGIMLYIVYILLVLFLPPKGNKPTQKLPLFTQIIMPLVIILSIYTITNPYTFSSPLTKMLDLIIYRQGVVDRQIQLFSQDFLPDLGSRIKFMVSAFLDNSLFLFGYQVKHRFLNMLLSIFFIPGFISEINRVLKRNLLSMFLLFSFLTTSIITILYLQLAWQRYLIHLVIFFVYYQTAGVLFITNILKNMLFMRNKYMGTEKRK